MYLFPHLFMHLFRFTFPCALQHGNEGGGPCGAPVNHWLKELTQKRQIKLMIKIGVCGINWRVARYFRRFTLLC